MIRRSLLTSTLLAIAAMPAAAQPPAPTQPPRALVRQLWADLEPGHLLRREGFGELPRAITVERRDLNGDGRPEWFVEGTRVCGNANCPRWIYRALPDGRFQQVYEEGSVRIDVQTERTHGWPALVSVGHMSCCETVFRRSVWEGAKYTWRDTEYREKTETAASRLVYHVSLGAADARGRRRLALDPMDAGGGLWISAAYDVCARGQACGEPRLVLQSASLPAGRVCASLRTEDPGGPVYTSAGGERWCGVTTPAALPGGGAGRRLEVRPTRRDWGQIVAVYEMSLSGPGLPGRLGDGSGALMSFAWSLRDVYTLPCVGDVSCPAARR